MMFPRTLTAPEPQAAPEPEPEPARSAGPSQASALFAAIKAERVKRLAAQPAAAATPRPLRTWEIVGMIALALMLANHFLPASTTATTRPAAAARGVIGETGGFGCPTKAHIEQMRDLINRAPKSLAWMLYAERHCERFRTGERLIIDRHFAWDSMYLARRPGDLVNLYFAEGVIDREPTP